MNTTTVSKNIYLISCAKTKLNRKSRADELYASPLFIKSIQLSKQMIAVDGGEIGILSAKYGLILPDTEIEPYELTLNEMNIKEKKQWAIETFNSIINQFGIHRKYIFITGKEYHCHIVKIMDANKIQYEVMMNGLGIGQRLKYLNEKLENNK